METLCHSAAAGQEHTPKAAFWYKSGRDLQNNKSFEVLGDSSVILGERRLKLKTGELTLSGKLLTGSS